MAKYGLYTASDDDIVINNYRLIRTSFACPEQYDVFNNETGAQVGYLRLRHGYFRADCPAVGGDTVYEADPAGDGIFDDDERMPHLQAAVAAIEQWWENAFKVKNG